MQEEIPPPWNPNDDGNAASKTLCLNQFIGWQLFKQPERHRILKFMAVIGPDAGDDDHDQAEYD